MLALSSAAIGGGCLGRGRVSWRSSVTELWIDASAGAFGVLRLQPESKTSQQDFTMTSS